MGAELFSEYAAFRNSILYQDAILAKLSMRPSWTIGETLLAPTAISHIQEPEFSQTMCTALQIALVDLLRSWNVQPVTTLGHSSGEIAAAYAAGAHTAAEAIVVAYLRAQAVTRVEEDGRMLAVGVGPKCVLPYIQGKEACVKIAAVNSPESVTLSGDPVAIKETLALLEADKVCGRILRTGGKAYHSHHTTAVGEDCEHMLRQSISEIAHDIAAEPLCCSGTLWQSSVYPSKSSPGAVLEPSYWRQNLESPVLFSKAIFAMLDNENMNSDLLVEVGPHPALNGPLKQIRSRVEQSGRHALPVCLSTLTRGENAFVSMLKLSGNLFIEYTAIDLAAVNATDQYRLGKLQLACGSFCVDLPSYKYHYGPILYHENRYNKELRLRKYLRHDILGARRPGYAKSRPSWRNVLREKDIPWLKDHEVTLYQFLLGNMLTARRSFFRRLCFRVLATSLWPSRLCLNCTMKPKMLHL